jgi:hypothetical protein
VICDDQPADGGAALTIFESQPFTVIVIDPKASTDARVLTPVRISPAQSNRN